MKKRLLLKLGLVALLGAGLFVAWSWWTEPRTGICEYTAKRIKFGMAQAEITELIGLPPMGASEFSFLGVDDEEYRKTLIDVSDEVELFDFAGWSSKDAL